MIFDTHCHLNDEQLYTRIDEVIKSANEAGVNRFCVVGWNKDSSLLAIKIAEQYDNVYAIIGYHPTDVYDVSEEDFNLIMNLLDHPKVVALGEIGLDYYWIKEAEKREIQKQYFIRQIEEANKHKKPISIHNRDAIEDCLKILQEHHVDCGGVMHCYSGSVESMKEFLKAGMYISLGGPVTFKNAKQPKEVAKEVPLDRLLVETDSPYLTPHPFRGQVNEPKYIGLTLIEISFIKDIDKDALAEITTENAKRLFRI